MTTIPLHCVCLAFGSDGDVRRVMEQFPAAERIYIDDVWAKISRGQYRTAIEPIVVDEIVHQIVTQLRLGERVIIDAEKVDRKVRGQMIERLVAFGAPVYTFVCTDGENVAYRGTELIDARATELYPVRHLPVEDASEYLSAHFGGVTAVGDVHGMLEPLKTAITWAKERNHYIVFAGDILDYGNGSLEVADEVYGLVTRGEACFITGNHERKIMRWLDGYRVRLSEGNRTTTLGLMALSDTARTKWIGRFRGLYQTGRLAQRIGNLVFAHAAVAPSYWADASLSASVENMAFFGEIDTEKSKPDRPVSSYRWCEAVPSGQFAVVGHNIRSRSHPIAHPNPKGGISLFLDTGSGKGGILSSADFRFEGKDKLILRNFNIY